MQFLICKNTNQDFEQALTDTVLLLLQYLEHTSSNLHLNMLLYQKHIVHRKEALKSNMLLLNTYREHHYNKAFF